ncbi:MAG: hypothetical protein LBR74_03935, partial [Eubacterium sp.]|nr:hypothetical protein [Eubacterium sp.]
MKNLLKKLLLVEIVALISLSSFFVLPVNAADDPSDRITGMITGLRDLPDSSFKNVIYAAPDDFV